MLGGLGFKGAALALLQRLWRKSFERVSLTDFDGVGDGSALNDSAFARAKIYCDANNAELLIPNTGRSFAIGANVTLPNKVRCEGSVTGNFQCQYVQQKNGWVKGMNCYQLSVQGAWRCAIEDFKVSILYVDGFSSAWGSYNNQFRGGEVTVLTNLDMTNGPVNFNQFIGGIHNQTTLTGDHSRYGAGVTTMIDNVWIGVDLEPSGIQQTDADMNGQTLIGCWVEGLAGTIVGNFQILGLRASGEAAYAQFGRRYHLLGSPEIGQAGNAHGDFISLGIRNLLQGGGWDWLDASNKPVCMAQFGGWAPAVSVDATEPAGVGKTYGGLCAVAGNSGGIQLTVQPSGIATNPVGVLTLLYKGADFNAVEINNGGAVTYPIVNKATIDAGGGWKVLRISYIARATATTLINLYYQTNTTITIGACFATSERACPFPTYGADVQNNWSNQKLKGAVLSGRGANVAAANNLTLGVDGTYYQITGNTQINLLDNTSWTPGISVTLKFNGTPTVKHNQAASVTFRPIILNGAVDLVAAANNTLTLRYDDADNVWYEQSRKI